MSVSNLAPSLAYYPAVIDFGRAICSDRRLASQREWLVTNGIGGFACGTISAELTRRYHGLLVASLQPPLGRTLLVTKFREVAEYAGKSYRLYTDRMASGVRGVAGCVNLERFYLDGGVPVWQFTLGDALLEKRLWMEQGENTTYVQYSLLRGSAQLRLQVQVLVNYRDYHGATSSDWEMQTTQTDNGLRISAGENRTDFYVFCRHGRFTPRQRWVKGFSLAVEQYRGFQGLENHLHCADFHAELQPGDPVALVASLEADARLDAEAAYARRKQHEAGLLSLFEHSGDEDQAVVARLALAADQFIVARPVKGQQTGHSVIAGYPWFGDWGRDTMISLPGLTLATGRAELARSILQTYAEYVDNGMLPNRFPDEGQAPEYNTVDATLWYFDALRAYMLDMQRRGKQEDGISLLEQVFPNLQQIIDWHLRGTRYQIHVDRQDGLLYAGEGGVQLTWMDAKVASWVVTPRIGKPVEINALWYNALQCMSEFAQHLGAPPAPYQELAQQVASGFKRFWNDERGYCFDVIDSPNGADASLRPNQLFAIALPYNLLTGERARSVVDACARHLLTSHGLRSLAPFERDYQGQYGGDLRKRDAAYHQGTVWSWLIGPFVRAHLRVYGDHSLARSYLQPLVHHLADHGLGSVSEIFDGDPPHAARGCFAQAWGVAELLRAWLDTKE